jgi:hypothetical protein
VAAVTSRVSTGLRAPAYGDDARCGIRRTLAQTPRISSSVIVDQAVMVTLCNKPKLTHHLVQTGRACGGAASRPAGMSGARTLRIGAVTCGQKKGPGDRSGELSPGHLRLYGPVGGVASSRAPRRENVGLGCVPGFRRALRPQRSGGSGAARRREARREESRHRFAGPAKSHIQPRRRNRTVHTGMYGSDDQARRADTYGKQVARECLPKIAVEGDDSPENPTIRAGGRGMGPYTAGSDGVTSTSRPSNNGTKSGEGWPEGGKSVPSWGCGGPTGDLQGGRFAI